MQTTVSVVKLHDNAHTLRSFLDEIAAIVKDEETTMHAVYVEDQDGRYFDSIRLVRDTLSDGSSVFNLVLATAP